MAQYSVALLGKDRAIPGAVRLVLGHLRGSGPYFFPAWPTNHALPCNHRGALGKALGWRVLAPVPSVCS